jgi:hypothetical protein
MPADIIVTIAATNTIRFKMVTRIVPLLNNLVAPWNAVIRNAGPRGAQRTGWKQNTFAFLSFASRSRSRDTLFIPLWKSGVSSLRIIGLVKIAHGRAGEEDLTLFEVRSGAEKKNVPRRKRREHRMKLFRCSLCFFRGCTLH